MLKFQRGWSLVVGALLLVPLTGRAVETPDVIAVIANVNTPVTIAAKDELRAIFQTKKLTWPDGSAVRAFNLPEESSYRRGFDAAVLGLDPERVLRFWLDRKIRGGERPPLKVPSSTVMLRVVSKTPGAIGYVEAAVVDKSVKVVAKVVNGMVIKP
jgi:ABC-type phosphate transport system substrate-binding protein